MDEGGSVRQTLEEAWRQRLYAAGHRYRNAKLEAKRAAAEQLQGLIPSPDRVIATRRALREESDALSEYMRVITAFNQSILDGKLPEDSPEHESVPHHPV